MHDRECPPGDRPRADILPTRRPRRLRRTPAMRDLVAETHLARRRPGRPAVRPRGHRRRRSRSRRCPASSSTPREPAQGGRRARPTSGVRAVILFGVPGHKDAVGSGAFDPDGIVQVALARPARRRRRRRRADGRPVRRRVHRPRPLRHRRRRTATSTTTRRSRSTPRPRSPRRTAGAARGGAERDDGRPGRGDPRRARRRRVHRRGDPRLLGEVRERRCTGRSATRSTSRSSAAATARDTSRTGATPARRSSRSTPTSPRAPTW